MSTNIDESKSTEELEELKAYEQWKAQKRLLEDATSRLRQQLSFELEEKRSSTDIELAFNQALLAEQEHLKNRPEFVHFREEWQRFTELREKWATSKATILALSDEIDGHYGVQSLQSVLEHIESKLAFQPKLSKKSIQQKQWQVQATLESMFETTLKAIN